MHCLFYLELLWIFWNYCTLLSILRRFLYLCDKCHGDWYGIESVNYVGRMHNHKINYSSSWPWRVFQHIMFFSNLFVHGFKYFTLENFPFHLWQWLLDFFLFFCLLFLCLFLLLLSLLWIGFFFFNLFFGAFVICIKKVS